VKNDEADRLSRIGTKREYYLKEEHYQRAIEALEEKPEEDAFGGTPYLPSRVAPDHISDALRQDWKGRKMYIHPPPCMILKTVQKALNDGALGVLVLPDWKGQTWEDCLRRVRKRVTILGPFEEVMELTPRFRSEGWRLPPGNVQVVSLDTKTTPADGSSTSF
jgi:hypothetical protein